MFKSKSNRSPIGIVILSCLLSSTVNAGSILDGVDPCVKAEKAFKTEQSKIFNALDAEKKRVESMPMPNSKYKKIWDKVAYESAKKQVIDRYSGINFTPEQIGSMGQKEVDNYIKTVGESGVQDEMLTIFKEHKNQALQDLLKEKHETTKELDKQKDELDKGCGTGEGERILRVVIAGVANRIESMNSESSLDAKAIKFTTGISLADIKKHGLLGGPNSEARKVAKGIENIVSANIEAAKREKGTINQTIRATTGISIKDIKTHGILGGKNSEARKIFKALGF